MNESVKIEEINESFVVLKAPRTVIAVHSNGSLYLVQVGVAICCHGYLCVGVASCHLWVWLASYSRWMV